MPGIQRRHDVWVGLTFISICGWVALILSMWNLLLPLKKIWPELYFIFQFVGLAILGVMVEIGCAEIAAAFFQPVITDPRNLYLRLSGRACEALLVWVAFIVRMVVKIGKANGK